MFAISIPSISKPVLRKTSGLAQRSSRSYTIACQPCKFSAFQLGKIELQSQGRVTRLKVGCSGASDPGLSADDKGGSGILKTDENFSAGSLADIADELVHDIWSHSRSYAHKLIGVGLFLSADLAFKKLFLALKINFPAPLGGMFTIIAALLIINTVRPNMVRRIFYVVNPALEWITRWMPLFYVPSLIALPLALQGIDPMNLYKIAGITVVGCVASLLFVAQVAVMLRSLFGGSAPVPPGPCSLSTAGLKNVPPPALHSQLFTLWGSVWLASLAVAHSRWLPMEVVAIPYMLASVVCSFILGARMPDGMKKILSPLIACFVITDVAAWFLACAYDISWKAVLKAFLTRGVGQMGAGDMLMRFLGCVVLSFGFRVFQQRDLVKRHAVEILGSTTLASFFSMASTLAVGRAVGLDPLLTRAIAPRAVTVALALPIGVQLGVPELAAITAVTVALTGLLGANIAQALLDKFGYKDPITRGMATAAGAHGLGTAALAASERDALPFAAIAYAFIGIISNLLVAVPFIYQLFISIAG